MHCGRWGGRVRYLCPSSTPAPGIPAEPQREHPESSTRRAAHRDSPGPGHRPIARHCSSSVGRGSAALRMCAPRRPAPTTPGRQLLFCSAPILARDRAGSGAASLLHEARPGRGAEPRQAWSQPRFPAPFCLPPQLGLAGIKLRARTRPRALGDAARHLREPPRPVPQPPRAGHRISQQRPPRSARLSSPCRAGGTQGRAADGTVKVAGDFGKFPPLSALPAWRPEPLPHRSQGAAVGEASCLRLRRPAAGGWMGIDHRFQPHRTQLRRGSARPRCAFIPRSSLK